MNKRKSLVVTLPEEEMPKVYGPAKVLKVLKDRKRLAKDKRKDKDEKKEKFHQTIEKIQIRKSSNRRKARTSDE